MDKIKNPIMVKLYNRFDFFKFQKRNTENIKIFRKKKSKPMWHIRKFYIRPAMELIKFNYRNFDPHKYIFQTIQIQTKSSCNLNCQFCPNNKIQKEHGEMSLELYKKIINQLSEISYSGYLLLYLQNEPLLDKRMPELIKIARERCPNASIVLFSNGTYLTDDLLYKLFHSGLSFMRINDYSNVQSNKPEIAEEYQISTKITSFNNYSLLEHVIMIVNYPPTIKRLSNRSGLINGTQIPIPLNLFCSRPFEAMYINFKGEALLCCNDWLFSEIMGDTNDNTLIDIWTNQKYYNFRYELLKNRRKGICFECDVISFFLHFWKRRGKTNTLRSIVDIYGI